MEKLEYLNWAYDVIRKKGLAHTQKDFANIVGLNKATLSRAFNGDSKYLTDGFINKIKHYMENELPVTEETIVVLPGEPETIPVIPTGARAGTLGEFADGIQEYQCERIVTPIRGAEYAIQVTGDSMSPEYPNGSHIIIKKIDEKMFVEWGKVYVLDTENGAVIKQVKKTDNPEVVECVSLNPLFQSFTINTNHIKGWYRVLMVLALK